MEFDEFIFSNVLYRRVIDAFSSKNNIFIYSLHGTHDSLMESKCRPPKSSLHIDILRKAIISLLRHYSFISLDDAIENLTASKPLKKKCAVLTFDDSLKSHYALTVPLLNEFNINGTFYISTQVIERQKPYWWRRLENAFENRKRNSLDIHFLSKYTLYLNAANDKTILAQIKNKLKWTDSEQVNSIVESVESQLEVSFEETLIKDPFAQILSWSDIIAMHNAGMTIGNHTVTHANLKKLSGEKMHFELDQSKQAIKEHCGIETLHFAYPYGYFSEETKREIKKIGYSSAVTTMPGWSDKMTDLFALPRNSLKKKPNEINYIISELKQKVQKCRNRLFNRNDVKKCDG
jgi:peptidoglycan/xylan/chitin deacetylase (PgdA/CDA1 family)